MRALKRGLGRILLLGLALAGCGALPPTASGAESCVLTLRELSAVGSTRGSLTLEAIVSASEGCVADEGATALVSWSTRGSCPDMVFELEPRQAFPSPKAGGEATATTAISTKSSGSCSFRAVLECYRFVDCRTEPSSGDPGQPSGERLPVSIKDWEGSYHFNP